MKTIRLFKVGTTTVDYDGRSFVVGTEYVTSKGKARTHHRSYVATLESAARRVLDRDITQHEHDDVHALIDALRQTDSNIVRALRSLRVHASLHTIQPLTPDTSPKRRD